jgi:hypothetical protein
MSDKICDQLDVNLSLLRYDQSLGRKCSINCGLAISQNVDRHDETSMFNRSTSLLYVLLRVIFILFAPRFAGCRTHITFRQDRKFNRTSRSTTSSTTSGCRLCCSFRPSCFICRASYGEFSANDLASTSTISWKRPIQSKMHCIRNDETKLLSRLALTC